MELRQLKYFKAIADARSFIRGAYHLRVAQPALSRSIAQLEAELGRSLFARHSGGVNLTDAGKLLYEHCDLVLHRVQRLRDELMATSDGPQGVISWGMPPSMQNLLTAPVAVAFLKAYPQATLQLTQNTSANLRDDVANGKIDLAVITTLVPASGIQTSPLATEGVGLIDLASRWKGVQKPISIEALTNRSLIIAGYPNTLRMLLEDVFAKYGAKPNIRCEVNSASLLTEIVVGGAGAGVVPYCAIDLHRSSRLKVLPIDGLRVSWSIATAQRGLGSLGVERLAALILERTRHVISTGKWPTAVIDE